jgi:hypothetical protein
MNIVDLIKEQQMKEPTQPTPTEKFQIVIVWITPQPPNIQRFNSVKKGMKVFEAMCKAWEAHLAPYEPKRKPAPLLFNIDGDMFFSCIDLSQVAQISYVDHAKRAKFIPV